MELFYMFFGVAMIYSWIHSLIIVGDRLGDRTTYENAVLIFALATILLYIFGTMAEGI